MRKIVKKVKKVVAYETVKPRIRSLLTRHDKVMLNVGCGTDYKKGWINIDNNSDNNIDSNKLDLNWDLRNPLPFPEGSVDFIFNEHLIEHLTVDEGRRAIEDLMRVLKPGGVLRIATPDLEEAVKIYRDYSLKDQTFLKKFQLDFIKTRAELLNISMRWWGHQWLYDWEELERRLREAGCNKIKKCRRGKSNYKELNNLEIRDESILIAEVTK